MLVHEADLILRKQDDPGAYGTRQKLLEGLEALRSLPELDRTGLFLQLGRCVGRPVSSARSPRNSSTARRCRKTPRTAAGSAG